MAQYEESSGNMYEEMGRTINIDVETESTAGIGSAPEQALKDKTHPSPMAMDPRRPPAIRDKVFRFRKVKGTETLKPTQCRRLLCLIETANGRSVVEARMDCDEEDFWKFSAQVTIAILVAFLTFVVWNALRQNEVPNSSSGGSV